MENIVTGRKWISKEMLKKIGYSFENEYEELLFVEMANQNFLYELGMAISKKMSKEQTETVRQIIDSERPLSESRTEYINSLLPNHERTVRSVYKRYIKHLKKNKKTIIKDIEKWRKECGYKQ